MPSWSILLAIFAVFLIVLLVVYFFLRKMCKKLFNRGDRSGKNSVDLKAMPLLGNTFKDKVRSNPTETDFVVVVVVVFVLLS